MKNDLRYSCGFHTPKIPKCYFIQIWAILNFHIYCSCLLHIMSLYDTNNYNFESFASFSTRQKKNLVRI